MQNAQNEAYQRRLTMLEDENALRRNAVKYDKIKNQISIYIYCV
jgi:hypothetical protein